MSAWFRRSVRSRAGHSFSGVSFLSIVLLLVTTAIPSLSGILAFGQTAHFLGTTTTLATGFNTPFGIAVDGAGNLFVADSRNNVVKEIPFSGGSYGTPVTIGSGFNRPFRVAVDGADNVFVADSQNNAVKKIPYSGGSYGTPVTLGSGFSNPEGVAVDSAGNVYVADTNNDAIKEIPYSGSSYGAPVTLVSPYYSPYGIAVDGAGNLFVADDSSDVKLISYSGGNYQYPVTLASNFYHPEGIAVDSAGNVYVTDTNNAVKQIPFNGGSYEVAVKLGGGFNNPFGIAVDRAGNLYVADSLNNAVKKIAFSIDFGATNIGGATPVSQTIAFQVDTTGTFGPPAILTGGAPNLDFTLGNGSTCTGTLNSGATCNVIVNFAPTAAGARNGAVELVSTTGAVLATAYLKGTGTGAQVVFPSNNAAKILESNIGLPYGVAVDGAGNVFVADINRDAIREIPYRGGSYGTSVTLGSGFRSPYGVAVDGAGNVFVADTSNGAVKEIPYSGGGYGAPVTLAGGFKQPYGVAVDGAGNVFVTDQYYGSVKEIPYSGSSYGAPVTVGSGFNGPYGVAVDGAGNVFVADYNNSAVKKIPYSGGSYGTPVPLASGSKPTGIAVDGVGNIYLSDPTNNVVQRVPYTSGSYGTPVTLGGGAYPLAVAVDAAGNVYTVNASSNAVKKLSLATPPTLSFTTPTLDGTTDTADGPKTVTVANIGNAPLSFFSPTPRVSTGFSLGTESSSCVQLSNMTLSIGSSCTLTATFAPVVPQSGAVSGSVLLTDNSLTASYASQSIPLAGTATAPAFPSLNPYFGGSLSSIPLGGTTAFYIQITNVTASDLSNFSATATLPLGFQAAAGSLRGNCTGTSSYSPSSSVISLSGLALTRSATCTFGITLKAVGLGLQTVTASTSINGQNSNPATASVTVVDVPTSLQITGAPASAYLGGSVPFTVTVLDPLNNPDLAYTGTVTFTSSDPGAGLPASATLTNGTGTFTATFNTLGNQTITATDSANILSFTTSPILVSVPNLVVTTNQDDAGTANNCTVQTTPGTGTDASCSLRDALLEDAVLGSASITFDGTVFSASNTVAQNTITLGASGALALPKNTAVSSPYRVVGGVLTDRVTVGAYNQIGSGVFSLNSGTASLTGLAIANGTALDGGSIFNNGTLTLSAATVMGGSGGNGGGIRNTGTLTVVGSTLTHNHATTGGVIHNSGSATVSGSTFMANSSDYNGGSIYNTSGSLTISGSTFTGNSSYGGAGGTIENYGALKVSGSTFTGNSASNSGGGIDNESSLTVSQSTFAGNSSANSGGGIANFGSLTVTEDTFTSNSAPQGGGIFHGGPVFIGSGSTFASNSASTSGGGIYNYSPGSLANTIVSGNTAGTGADTYGYFSDRGGNVIGGTGVNPSALGSYGGPTQTVLPLPASTAICAGTSANATAAGITADQRGLPFNSACPAGLVDSGAVQTNYALSFTADPPANAAPGTSMSPAPAVTVTESGLPLTAGLATLLVTDDANDLTTSPATTGATSNGIATLSGLIFTGATTGDTLTATLPLNSILNLTATSKAFNVTQVTPVVSFVPTVSSQSYGTAITGATLNATATANGSPVIGSFTYTTTIAGTANQTVTAGVTVLPAATYSIGTTFTPSNTSLYTSASAVAGYSVNQATPVVTWNAPAAITYGTALSATQLSATASVPGSFSYTPASGVLSAGSQTLSVKFTPTDTTDYLSVTKTVTLAVNQATPVVTWNAPAAITYGTALSATQLNATASVPGSFSYAPAAGTVLGAGSQTLSVKFTPTDTADYVSVTKTVTLAVNQATPVVTWNTPAGITYGTALSGTQLNATASVPGSFSYVPASGTVLGAGSQTLSVKFTPTDTANYVSVTKTVTLAVNQATPVVTWNTPAAITYGTALSATQLNATASVPGSFSYTPASGVLNAGSQTLSVKFTPTDTANYTTASGTVTLAVNQATPVVTWNTPAGITYGTALSGTQLNATASVPGNFSYAPAAGIVLGAGSQTLSVKFTPTDMANYVSVTKTVTLAVNRASTTVTNTITTMQTVTGTTATITATVKPLIGGTPTGTITYLNGTTTLGSIAVGTPFTTPVLPVGTNQLTAVYSGDANFTASTSSATAVVSLAPSVVQLYPALNRLIYPLSQVLYTVTVPLKLLQFTTGTITLYDGNTAIGTANIPPFGTYSGITAPLSVGVHSLRAVYNGDSNYPPGQSPIVVVTVANP